MWVWRSHGVVPVVNWARGHARRFDCSRVCTDGVEGRGAGCGGLAVVLECCRWWAGRGATHDGLTPRGYAQMGTTGTPGAGAGGDGPAALFDEKRALQTPYLQRSAVGVVVLRGRGGRSSLALAVGRGPWCGSDHSGVRTDEGHRRPRRRRRRRRRWAWSITMGAGRCPVCPGRPWGLRRGCASEGVRLVAVSRFLKFLILNRNFFFIFRTLGPMWRANLCKWAGWSMKGEEREQAGQPEPEGAVPPTGGPPTGLRLSGAPPPEAPGLWQWVSP